jgi:hypothetical protein
MVQTRSQKPPPKVVQDVALGTHPLDSHALDPDDSHSGDVLQQLQTLQVCYLSHSLCPSGCPLHHRNNWFRHSSLRRAALRSTLTLAWQPSSCEITASGPLTPLLGAVRSSSHVNSGCEIIVVQVSVAIERHERSRLAAELNASWEMAARTLQERESLRAELASARPALQKARATAEAEATERERLALQLAHAKSRLYLLRANGPTSARSRRTPLVTELAAALRALLNAPQQSLDDDDVQQSSSKCVARTPYACHVAHGALPPVGGGASSCGSM